MSARSTDCQLCLSARVKTQPVKKKGESRQKREGKRDGSKYRWRLFVRIIIKTCAADDNGEERQLNRQTPLTEPQRQVDRLTWGINVYLIVHCSVAVLPLHPAKWLLINQPDLLLYYSADWLLVSGRRRVVIDPVRMTKDQQELLKHNNSLSRPVSPSLSLSVYLPLRIAPSLNEFY